MFNPGDKVVYNVFESPNSLNDGLVYQKTYIIKHKFTRWLYFDKNDSSLELCDEFLDMYLDDLEEIHVSGFGQELNHSLLYKSKQIKILNKLKQIILKFREQSGVLNFDFPETVIDFDADGNPI
jgi:hypothetical protein